MNTEYAVGNIRIRFESRARRRWFVALVYAVLALFVVNCTGQSRDWLAKHAPWYVCGLGVLIVALMIVFTWLTDDIRRRGDERETHRREHAYAVAYRVLGTFLVAALFATYFRGPNPITPLLSPSLRAFLMELPYMFLFDTGILYVTLPQAILLWTEPDMEEAQ